eukprot:TRINITY_DN71581_c0_g1_i1.p1 TRINITY_DN71581_c0_g1~~TRINITY_DN71581_c0_g1_i1.p1  ORF type:complete len:248 (-),score=46.44 TRINITY_DN71581_c0_g1_i1:25-768(-)
MPSLLLGSGHRVAASALPLLVATRILEVALAKEERLTPASAVRSLESLARFLDEYEANVVDMNGQTVTHWAASVGNADAIDYAVEQGADLKRVDNDKRTPVHIASLSGHEQCVARLLKHGASADARDKAGATPLYRAAMAGSAGTVRVLAKASPKSVDARFPRTKGTALHTAAYLGHVAVIEALLEVGASPCIRNDDEELPMERFVDEDEDAVATVIGETPVVGKVERQRVIDMLRDRSKRCSKADL